MATTLTYGGLTANVAIEQDGTPKYNLDLFMPEVEIKDRWGGLGKAVQNNGGGKGSPTATIEITGASAATVDSVVASWLALVASTSATITISHAGASRTADNCILLNVKPERMMALGNVAGTSNTFVTRLGLEFIQVKP